MELAAQIRSRYLSAKTYLKNKNAPLATPHLNGGRANIKCCGMRVSRKSHKPHTLRRRRILTQFFVKL